MKPTHEIVHINSGVKYALEVSGTQVKWVNLVTKSSGELRIDGFRELCNDKKNWCVTKLQTFTEN